MCNIWKHPTSSENEVSLQELDKLPSGIKSIHLTGGEPTLRADLEDIATLLRTKTKNLEISTNALIPKRLLHLVEAFPETKVRISVDGLGETSNRIRGEEDGFERKIDTMRRLIRAGGRDLGFAITCQDQNAQDVLALHRLSKEMDVEFAVSTVHNGYQFHKTDNQILGQVAVIRQIEALSGQMLRSHSVKEWFRAYLNLGLIAKILGEPRLHACTAGSDFVFIDPWSDVYACNIRPDLLMGNLRDQPWDKIWSGSVADEIRLKVASCPQNCWLGKTAANAIRNKHLPFLPKVSPLAWVIANKLRVSLGKRIPFERYVSYPHGSLPRPPSKRDS